MPRTLFLEKPQHCRSGNQNAQCERDTERSAVQLRVRIIPLFVVHIQPHRSEAAPFVEERAADPFQIGIASRCSLPVNVK